MNPPSSNPSAARIIGLTGGIGMGKTTVSDYLDHVHHLPILDADVYAREAVRPGSPLLAAIAERYGEDIILPDGTLARHQLGKIVFNNSSERLWLEQQIHPYVRQSMNQARDRLIQRHSEQSLTLVMVIPLLFEANLTSLVTEIWVVACPLEQQIERLRQREQLTLDQIQARINSQMPIQSKIDRADFLLNNDSTLEALLKQVDQALENRTPVKLTTTAHG